jgi:hypothetical protein
MSAQLIINAILVAAGILYVIVLRMGISNRDAEISGLLAHVETHRQEVAKLRSESNMYQNELKEVRDKCVALRERAQITEGWGDATALQLGILHGELSHGPVINRLPVRFVPILNSTETLIKNRANAMLVVNKNK